VLSGFSVHLISLRNSPETSDRGALSMPKKNHETHNSPYGTFNTARSNHDDLILLKSNIFLCFLVLFAYVVLTRGTMICKI
jgi:hypothetical protein